ncbi:hypothetical protein Dimus_021946 [Dionaea muscipula]
MISHRHLFKIAKKWQKFASLRRKRICSPQTIAGNIYEDQCTSSSRPEKGHFTVYTVDKRRFMIPLEYLKNGIFKKLLEAAEEEFGMPSDGPITLPFDAIFMEHVLCMIQKHSAKDMQKALSQSIASQRCLPSSAVLQEQRNNQSTICSF